MLHRSGATILLPEAVIIGKDRNRWVQPQWVYAPQLLFSNDGEPHAKLPFAALDPARRDSSGLFCEVEFARNDRRAVLADGSEVYRCRVATEHSPADLTIGRGHIRGDGGVNLRLYHHTAPATLPLIKGSGHVRGSAWNYQGTRKLTNVAYAYFTSLQEINTEQDLQSIAMATAGQLALRLDTNPDPQRADLVLDVYRGSTRDRKATLTLWVPAELVSTPHIWQHSFSPVIYEIAHPWIYRIGLQPGAHLDFLGREATPDPAALKRFDYAVIGDCTTLVGLEAPFDEENTSATFSVQDLTRTDLFEFWRTNANTPLHAAPRVTQEFKP